MKTQSIEGFAYELVLQHRIDKIKILPPLKITKEQLKRYIIAEGYGK